MSSPPITIVIAGSTEYTRDCAEVLAADPAFSIVRVLTPTPKLVGRKQLLTENPLHHWAQAATVPVTLIQKRIDQSIKAELWALERPSLLLVVDFGYFIPRWLLEWPKDGPLNIHPSQLPRWRGSSPGQFPLLYGDDTSAVTLMVINEEFDSGSLLESIPFKVNARWTARDYYQHAYSLITKQLPSLLKAYLAGELSPTPQPAFSSTPVAHKLSREDGFISWQLLERLILGTQEPADCEFGAVSPILLDAFSATGSIYLVVERAIRAFFPWPGIWTELPTINGSKRLKILSARLQPDLKKSRFKLELLEVQLEGKQPTDWNKISGTIGVL